MPSFKRYYSTIPTMGAIVVTAPTGSTVTCDGISVSEVSSTWTFFVSLGSYTIVASKDGKTSTETVVVSSAAVYNITIKYSRLPSGFQECEYIRSSGTQYIDTNMGYDTSSVCTLIYQFNADLGGDYSLFGTQWIHDGWADGLFMGVLRNYWRAGNNYSGGQEWIHYAARNSSDKTTFVCTNNQFTWNSTTVSFTRYASLDYPLYIFTQYRSDGVIEKLHDLTVYEYIHSKNNTEIQHFIPCYCTTSVTAYQGATQTTAAAGTIGMYDLAGGRFYINSGSGTFTKGPDV